MSTTKRAKSSPIASPATLDAFLLRLTRRTQIALKVDSRILAVFRRQADARGIGYQTLMHDVLATAALSFAGKLVEIP